MNMWQGGEGGASSPPPSSPIIRPGSPSPDQPILHTCSACGQQGILPYGLAAVAAQQHGRYCVGPLVRYIATALGYRDAEPTNLEVVP